MLSMLNIIKAFDHSQKESVTTEINTEKILVFIDILRMQTPIIMNTIILIIVFTPMLIGSNLTKYVIIDKIKLATVNLGLDIFLFEKI